MGDAGGAGGNNMNMEFRRKLPIPKEIKAMYLKAYYGEKA